MKKKVIITQDPEKPVAPEIMAQAIVDISAAAKKLLGTRLTKRAVIILIRDSFPKAQYSGNPNITQIEQVLDAAEGLEAKFLKPKVKRLPYHRS